MASTGNSYENEQAESIFITLYDKVNQWNYRTLAEGITRFPYFIQFELLSDITK
jgi:hypothetical protein